MYASVKPAKFLGAVVATGLGMSHTLPVRSGPAYASFPYCDLVQRLDLEITLVRQFLQPGVLLLWLLQPTNVVRPE